MSPSQRRYRASLGTCFSVSAKFSRNELRPPPSVVTLFMAAVGAIDRRTVSPCLPREIEDIVTGVGRAGSAPGRFWTKNSKVCRSFQGQSMWLCAPSPSPPKRLWIVFGSAWRHPGMQLRCRIPDREDRPALVRAIVLDAAIASCRLSGVPVGPAVIDVRMSRQHGDLAVKARRFALAFQVPPQMLGVGRRGEENQGNQKGHNPFHLHRPRFTAIERVCCARH